MRLRYCVHTSASPAQVWELLGNPARWGEFDLVLGKVRGSAGRASSGQRLLGLSRIISLRIPVDIVESAPEQRLVLLVHTLPGVRQEITFELTPTVRGGTDIRVGTVVEGLFGRLAVVPLWAATGVSAKVLAVRSRGVDRTAREPRGVA